MSKITTGIITFIICFAIILDENSIYMIPGILTILSLYVFGEIIRLLKRNKMRGKEE